MNILQKCFASLLPRKHPSELLKGKKETLNDLIARYHQAQGEEEKEELSGRIFALFPETLFLASICYPEDDPSRPVSDRTLHGSQGAKQLFEKNQAVVMNGNPGFKIAKKDGNKRMHLRTLVSKSSNQSWIPLFTDFTQYIPFFGVKTRAALFTLREVKAMCQSGQGILITPGEHAFVLTAKDFHRIR